MNSLFLLLIAIGTCQGYTEDDGKVVPHEGSRYVYADLQTDEQNIHYVDAHFGSPKQPMRLWVSLVEE